jgi:hypothetical protein
MRNSMQAFVARGVVPFAIVMAVIAFVVPFAAYLE